MIKIRTIFARIRIECGLRCSVQSINCLLFDLSMSSFSSFTVHTPFSIISWSVYTKLLIYNQCCITQVASLMSVLLSSQFGHVLFERWLLWFIVFVSKHDIGDNDVKWQTINTHEPICLLWYGDILGNSLVPFGRWTVSLNNVGPGNRAYMNK